MKIATLIAATLIVSSLAHGMKEVKDQPGKEQYNFFSPTLKKLCDSACTTRDIDDCDEIAFSLSYAQQGRAMGWLRSNEDKTRDTHSIFRPNHVCQHTESLMQRYNFPEEDIKQEINTMLAIRTAAIRQAWIDLIKQGCQDVTSSIFNSIRNCVDQATPDTYEKYKQIEKDRSSLPNNTK